MRIVKNANEPIANLFYMEGGIMYVGMSRRVVGVEHQSERGIISHQEISVE